MESVLVFLLLFFYHFRLHSAKDATKQYQPDCPPFFCGIQGGLRFPFANAKNGTRCGLLMVDGCDNNTQKIQLKKGGRCYPLTNIINQANDISIRDEELHRNLQSNNCQTFNNLTFPNFPYLSFRIQSNLTLFKCPQNLSLSYLYGNYESCNKSSIYYPPEQKNLPALPPDCSLIQLPGHGNRIKSNVFELIRYNFTLKVHVSHACWKCHGAGGDCQINKKGKFHCADLPGNNRLKLELGLGLGLGGGIILLGLMLFLYVFYRRRNSSLDFLSTKSFPDDPEGDNVFCSVPLFSYSELQEATSNFHIKKRLGLGGFGTVYYGKLKDGRQIAVKRLHEHNYRRVKQFMNEIEILTRLRHKNLVTLYGCTSRRSRELLLVYEYIPNGTVSDHLHGDRTTSSPLTWPIRMSIAVETAAALAYLHDSDIIHRDVKTNNILIDNNFCVKIADFGLSRLFPNDVTHISTAPQGTPGYVDPEYHHCYQLTEKSDVYSFGVVLIELISSMPAVDISRLRDEINLANLAVKKIQKGAFDELIDPCLGCVLDKQVKSMAISVAELAFLCLQQDKELRPSMDEVLEKLGEIESGNCNNNQEESYNDKDNNNKAMVHFLPQVSPPCSDEDWLFNNMQLPSSPNTVTAKWASGQSTASSQYHSTVKSHDISNTLNHY